MNKLKQQFSELRRNTPKHIQWILLAVAFVVVLILLTLLMTGRKQNNSNIADAEHEPVFLEISQTEIDWSDTPVGDKRSAEITLSASAPARVFVRQPEAIAGLTSRSTCNSGGISPAIPCTILLEYAPGGAATNEQYSISIDYRGASEPEELNVQEKITLTLGAQVSAPAEQPAPTPVPTPAPTPVYEPDPMPEPAPAPRQEIIQEIETLAPSDPFAGYSAFEASTPTPPAEPAFELPAERCSDFAFPGYNNSGIQTGWIKPERGAYYFHPFSDTDCNNPTGVYNPDTGIITDIKDHSKRIGTDAEHKGRAILSADGTIPQLSAAPRSRNTGNNDADDIGPTTMARMSANWEPTAQSVVRSAPASDKLYATSDPDVVISTQPYDRSFILRQYKPIPATIVSDVRADATMIRDEQFLPVRATVDRNVYSDNGRTIIIPTGTLLLGYVTGDIPGPYKTIGRMKIQWYQFILPNGVEFNFKADQDPFSGDSQGRVGVPGRGSTDYLEQFVMPMLTAIVPAAVNMIAPVADRFVNQIDLDNNTVVQSGTVRSSELAKNEIITAWNQVAQKLMVDMMDNTVPPFTIPAGTRITVYSPQDLAVSCIDPDKNCYFEKIKEPSLSGNSERRNIKKTAGEIQLAADDSWVGQVRSFNWGKYCENGKIKAGLEEEIYQEGLDYRNVLFYCQTNQYQAINNARQDAQFKAQQEAFRNNYGDSGSSNSDYLFGGGGTGSLTGIAGDTTYNEKVLGLVADENGYLSLPKEEAPAAQDAALTCLDGSLPDANGCCAGEEYTDMGEELGFNCCPISGGDCFPPLL